jgi:hypothetical protein
VHKALETAVTYHFDANVKMDVKSSQTTDQAKMAMEMLGTNPQLKGKLVEGDMGNVKADSSNADLYSKLDGKSFVSEDVSKDEKAKGAKKKITADLDPATAQTLFDEYMSKSGGGAGLTGGVKDSKLKGGHFVGLIGDKDRPLSDDIDLVVTTQGDELTMKVHIDYSKFGEKVNFTIDPSKAEIIKSDELQGLSGGAGALGGSL